MKSVVSVLCLCACVFAAVCVLPTVAQVPIPYSNCGSGADHLKIINATVSVWPLVAGQRALINFQGVLDEPLTADGTYSVQASFDGLPIINQQGSFSQFNVSWPIAAGPITIAKSVKIPSLLAGASIVVNVTAADGNGQEIACIGLALTAVSPSGEVPVLSIAAARAAAAVEEVESLFARSSKDASVESAIAQKDPASLLREMMSALFGAMPQAH